MSKSTDRRRLIVCFISFLLFAGVFGGIIALINQLLRKHGLDSPYTTLLSGAILIFVYYKAWRWMCRRLDLFGSGR